MPQTRAHSEELQRVLKRVEDATAAQSVEYERGKREALEAMAEFRDRAAAADKLQQELAKTRAALQEQLVRASSFNESEMLDRRVVKKLLVRVTVDGTAGPQRS